MNQIVKAWFLLLKKKRVFFQVFYLGFFLLFSCSPKKYIPKDKYLLESNKIQTSSSKIKEREFRKFIKQKSNKRILGLKIPMYLYSLSAPDKENKLNDFFRDKGEKPVVWDKYLTDESRKQIEYFLENKGYYDAVVRDTVILSDKKAEVKYKVILRDPYRIHNVTFNVLDSVLEPYVYYDTTNTLLEKGAVFDVELLEQERNRITKQLKDNGFYKFSKDFVNFIADTTVNGNHKNLVDITIQINKYLIKNEDDDYIKTSHNRYKINKIFVYPDYEPKEAIGREDEYMKGLDTTEHKGLFFIYEDNPGIKLNLVSQSNYLSSGEWYNQGDVNSTYQHLNSLRLFKMINIRFEEIDSSNNDNNKFLNAHIYLKKLTLQSYTVELEGTNSSGNLGGAGNFVYQHKSLLGGAENFETKLTGAFEILDPEKFSRIDNILKVGVELNLDIPKFLLPVLKSESFVKKYNPKTSFSLLYNYQERPDYTRTIANLSFGYKWKGNRFLDHFINPIELNILRLPFRSQEFENAIKTTYLRNSYEDHFLSLSSYSLIYNNQDVKKTRDFQYFRLNSEVGGNILTGINQLSKVEKSKNHYELFGIRYAQFIKLDFDIRHYHIFDPENRIVYRLFLGGGLPYGNSEALPFVKQYFSGGANSLRAWNVRALGPGSYSTGEELTYPNQTGDLKFETNVEYRFPMFWILEGALFVDAGNIWTIKEHENLQGAKFEIDKFIDELAVGTGFGLRFDLSFSVIRLDIGLKMHDPEFESGNRWLPGNRNISNNTLSWNIAIGYPF